jgi:hypothetical protein
MRIASAAPTTAAEIPSSPVKRTDISGKIMKNPTDVKTELAMSTATARTDVVGCNW